MWDDEEILEEIARVNESLANMDMLPSEVSGRDHGAFTEALFRTSPADWPGMYPHTQNMGTLSISSDPRQQKYRELLQRENEKANRMLLNARDQMMREKFQDKFQEGVVNSNPVSSY